MASDTHEPTVDRCPRCLRPGPPGTPCPEEGCARLGVHRVPGAFATEPHDDPVIGRMLDAWLVLGYVGRGGVGAIYLAEQQPVGLRAALKLLGPETSDLTSPERFLREAAALARLTHPNIVRLMAYGVDRGRPYLVMEYVEGARTLEAATPDLTVEDRHRVLVQMTHALEAAHGAAVVHRDLKPANVMLQAVAGEPHFVRLVDFGLAKFTDESAGNTIMAGTPLYMAPEQVTRQAIGPWTDLYALGVMACELLAGHRPFKAPTVNQMLLVKSDPAHDPLADARVEPALAAFLRRAMARDPQARFADAADMRRALLTLTPEEPVLAPTAILSDVEPPPPPRSGRGRLALGAVGVAGALVLGMAMLPSGQDPAAPDVRVDAVGDLTAPDAASDTTPDPAPVDAAVDAVPADARPPDAMPDVAAVDQSVRRAAGRRGGPRPPAAPPEAPPPRPDPERTPAPPAADPAQTELKMDRSWTQD